MNLFIAAKYIKKIGEGNDRDPSPDADATQSKGSVWVDFEAGRIDVVSNHTRLRNLAGGFLFDAFKTNAVLNPDLIAAERMSSCVRPSGVALDWGCVKKLMIG